MSFNLVFIEECNCGDYSWRKGYDESLKHHTQTHLQRNVRQSILSVTLPFFLPLSITSSNNITTVMIHFPSLSILNMSLLNRSLCSPCHPSPLLPSPPPPQPGIHVTVVIGAWTYICLSYHCQKSPKRKIATRWATTTASTSLVGILPWLVHRHTPWYSPCKLVLVPFFLSLSTELGNKPFAIYCSLTTVITTQLQDLLQVQLSLLQELAHDVDGSYSLGILLHDHIRDILLHDSPKIPVHLLVHRTTHTLLSSPRTRSGSDSAFTPSRLIYIIWNRTIPLGSSFLRSLSEGLSGGWGKCKLDKDIPTFHFTPAQTPKNERTGQERHGAQNVLVPFLSTYLTS